MKIKKTYVVAVAFLVLMLVPVFIKTAIPEWVWGVLASVGLTTIRLAIQSVNGNTGWKAYVAAGAVFVVSILSAFGIVIPETIIQLAYGIFGTLGIVGVRDAVEKLKT